MSTLHSIFNEEYDIRFEVRGNGTVSSEAFDGDVTRALERYEAECGRAPRDISLVIEDTLKAGFDYGFIGGCSAKIGNTIFFFGNIKSHSDYEIIKTFIINHNSKLEILYESIPLTDIGGAVII